MADSTCGYDPNDLKTQEGLRKGVEYLTPILQKAYEEMKAPPIEIYWDVDACIFTSKRNKTMADSTCGYDPNNLTTQDGLRKGVEYLTSILQKAYEEMKAPPIEIYGDVDACTFYFLRLQEPILSILPEKLYMLAFWVAKEIIAKDIEKSASAQRELYVGNSIKMLPKTKKEGNDGD